MCWLGQSRTLLTSLAAGLVAVAITSCQFATSPATLLAEAQTAFREGKFEEAQTRCNKLLARDPKSVPALLLGAKSATRLKDSDAALKFLKQLPETGSPEIAAAWHQAASLELQLGHASQAEQELRRALAIDPNLLSAHVDLAYLLGVEGRCWESVPYLLESIRRGQFTFHHLVLLGATEPVIADPTLIDRCRSATPAEMLPLIGLARNLLQQNEPERAEVLLRTVIASAPDSVEAHASLGRVLAAARTDAIPEWQSQLPPAADNHPDVWSVRGEWAEQHNQPKAAVRCFWEAVRRNPNHRGANYHLGQLLESQQNPLAAKPLLERAERLRELGHLVDQLYEHPDKLAQFHRAAEICEGLGRIWEAWGWSRIAYEQSPNLEWASRNLPRLQTQLSAELPQTLVSANLARQFDLSANPLPQWSDRPGEDTRPTISQTSPSAVRFVDVATKVGIDFTYSNRAGAKAEGMRMLETTGGGVAAFDYDLNGYPDLYFTQGCPWPPVEHQTEFLDQFFRNDGSGRFEQITALAGLGDPRYGQGVTVGDYDNDGFPDLYVANIGENRLYHNNGDGTFTDVSGSAGIKGSLWTTSCLIADLNGDSLPDIYDVNYLSLESAATQICKRGEEIHWCNPDAFDAEQDQVYLNLGDGRFENVTASSGIVTPNGKGLGIIAADFDQTGRLGLFIANDAVPNFLFVNQGSKSGDPIRFTEQAIVAGLAFDRDGLPQACMGVAAGDANGDGLFDMFITNFENQSNTLYRQQADCLFEDVTRRCGLREPSYKMLGFGTQFIDGELDGWPDLILTNGHVLDLSYKGGRYQMPPQYYRNLGAGRFEELPTESLGPFFQGQYLGRGLARLDWNRDGREDFVVSHMNSPAALVENQTPGTGHYLILELRGVQSSRDAIGATVKVTSGDRAWTRQLFGGDGYQCTNQRQLVFGLGQESKIDELEIKWPSGTRQIFRDLSADREILLIEGHPPLTTSATH
jgi:tetratricopeptide (TPR) repeat protein